jgi:hypothetical protein
VTGPQPSDWEYHDKALFSRDEADRAALLQQLADDYPKISDLIHRSGSGVIVAAVFEKTAALAHGILLVNPPLDSPFSIVIFSDKLEFDRAASLRAGSGPSGPDMAGTLFFRMFAEKLGKSLAASLTTGGRH